MRLLLEIIAVYVVGTVLGPFMGFITALILIILPQ